MTDSQNWRPACGLPALKARARLLQNIRAFFLARDVMEVDTPLASHGANPDPNTDLMLTLANAPGGGPMYLASSPELAMKRLLAAGSGAIYQICHAFRDGEAGREHNPEFTILEWYQPDYDLMDLMSELDELLDTIVGVPSGPARFLRYVDAFQDVLSIDPLTADDADLRALLGRDDLARDEMLDWLFSTRIQPSLHGRVFLTHFPASQAALACLDERDPRVAQRFELIINGTEIANGFYELTNAEEQRRRFEGDVRKRQAKNQATVALDENFLKALQSGMPECSGVAVGVDRLLMCAQGAEHLDKVLAFPLVRA